MSHSSSYAVSPWLTCYTPRPDASLRIFCFPHGGGGPHIYRQWADEFPKEIEVYALHLPGRGSRRAEPSVTEMDELASDIVDTLQTYLDKPCAFFGHSVGALVAFEVTRRMRNSGCTLPVRLFVSAHKAPHQSEEKSAMYKLPDEELVEVISQLGLVPDDALENEELLTFILPPIKADFQVSETYQYRKDLPLPVPITAMGGRQDSLITEQDLNAWQKYSSVDFQSRLYDGDHFYTQSLQETLLRDMADLLRSDLDNLPRSVMEGENKPYPELCLHELFRQQVERTPDKLAVVDVTQQLTFRELDEKTDLLARYLQKQGVVVDSLVGIYMESCAEFVIAYLAILKASGAYMPLETAYPQKLLENVLETAAPIAVLTKSAFSDNLPAEWLKGSRTLRLDDRWEKKIEKLKLPALDENRKLPTVDSLAYCVMTSGTTGAPKGILCPHRGAVNSYYWRYNHTPYQEDEREACNIFLVWEVIRPILRGYPAVIIPDQTIYDPRKLVAFLEEYQITRVLFTPSLLEQVLNTPGLDLSRRLVKLKIVWLNGEVVPTMLQARFFEQLPEVRLLNDYSISECHDVCTHDLGDLDTLLSPKYAPLGLPMSNVRIYLLDEQLRPVPRGVTAEIYVGGDSLARGYLNMPEKTAERFISDPLRQDESRLFRTGDLGMLLPNGHLEVKGRVEFMIKLRGYSIVLGAVETAIIDHPEVNTAVVVTSDNAETGQPESLIAYIVQNGNVDDDILAKELRDYLKKRLPHYAIPSIFITLTELPLHDVTGKLDRKKLPQITKNKARLTSPEPQSASHSALEQTILGVWEEILQIGVGHLDDNFFDLGGHSLLAIRMSDSLSQKLGVEVSVVDTYEYPTVKGLAEFLLSKTIVRDRNVRPQPRFAESRKDETIDSTDIAIIGMACRFPGADDVDQFWNNLQQGICSIRELSKEELAVKGVTSSVINNRDYRRIGALLGDVELFDPGFWGLSQKEAVLMDPQQRLFLESCYHAMEDAGYAPRSNGESTGVFGGCYSPTYLLYYLQGGGMTDPTDPGEFHLTETGNDKDYIATRVSYLLNLQGPSITVQTSCSTAAAVVASACQSLLAGQCRMAIAGASSITFPQGGYQYVEGHINSHDGAVRTFDAHASGTILGDGVGVVVLKRLDDAVKDGDLISAVIKGFSVNNDGKAKAGYSAPSVQGQKEMVRIAQDMAGVQPQTLSFIEAHGTGTLIGDPIEVKALTEVFRQTTDKKGFCALGSVKPNIGHSNIAAGMAGLIKTVLCLKHKKLVPQINFSTPNPALNIEESPFYINTTLQEWTPPPRTPRRAGITCLGIGGTNCHFILEESPVLPQEKNDESSWQLLTLSAGSEKSLEQSRHNLIAYLNRHPQTNLVDLAYTLQTGRDSFKHRLAVACPDIDSAIDKLKAAQTGPTFEDQVKLVFMFPGQGSQYPGMGRNLYRQEPLFRRYFDQCAELLEPLLGSDLRALVFAESGSPASKKAFSLAYHIQPAIFSLQYSLAKILLDWGVIPGALIGHSIGEYTAACIAGTMSLEDTLKLIVTRGHAMEEAQEGAMLSVNMTREEAKAYILENDQLSLAVINSARDMVLSGSVTAVDRAEKELTRHGTLCQRVHVARAFHSPMMDNAAERLNSIIDDIQFSPPRIPLVSNVSGTWLTEQQAVDKNYWAEHMKSTVLFADNLHTVLEDSPDILLEVGSHTILRQLAAKVVEQRGQEKKPSTISCLQHPRDKAPDIESFTLALSQLWRGGIGIDWQAYHAGQNRHRIPLPGYPFDGQVCWKDNRGDSPWSSSADHRPAAPPEGRSRLEAKITDIANRGYIPSWARSLGPQEDTGAQQAVPIRWLLFMEDDADPRQTLSFRMAEKLEVLGDTVIRVYQSYQPLHSDLNGTYYLNGDQLDDYQLLFQQMDRENCYPSRIIDFWSITGNNPERGCTLADTYYHALSLAQAVTAQKLLAAIDIWLVTDKTVQVNQESAIPLKSTLFGPSLVLPQENPHIACRLIDIEVDGESGDGGMERLVVHLLQECRALQPDPEPVIAYRGPHRWVQRYEPVTLGLAPPTETGYLRQEGIYIITGGLGRIGRTLAKHLGRLKTKLVLTTTDNFPGRHRWEKLAEDPRTDSKQLQALIHLLDLEAAGAEVMLMRTNMGRGVEVRRLVQATIKRYGGIDGIFHAAGVANLRYIPEMSYEISESEFAPKIQGLLNLDQAIGDCQRLTGKSPKFVFLFSSLASILGGYSMTAYAAANRVMDSFAQQNSGKNGIAWFCANWDDWDFDYTREQIAAYEQTTAKFAMSPEEGIETLERILATPTLVQVLVATRELAPRIEQWLLQQAMDGSPPEQSSHTCSHEPAKTKLQTRSADLSPPEESDTDLEGTVLEVYRSLLELPEMCVEDNFFHVGGDSLLASQILLKLRRRLPEQGSSLTLASVFDYPSVREMTGLLDTQQQ